MRFLHTADWHLGRTLNGAAFLPDQEIVLGRRFPDLVAETRPDAVLIAGDLYDRAVPPTDAVRLLDDILERIVLGLGVPVILIPGNHDDPDRLGFGAKLLREAGLHVANAAQGSAIPFADAHGPVAVLATGYASPLLLATLFAEAAVADHDSGFACICRHLRTLCPAGARSVVVAHAFVAGGAETKEAERALAVGGAKAVSPERFAGFHYVALGHLHRPQTLGEGRLRYSGSPLAYSFAEAAHPKSVTLVELDGTGAVRTEAIPLTPPRALRRIEGSFEQLMQGSPRVAPEDWLSVTLTDRLPVFEAQRRLAERYPHVLELAYASHAALDAPRAAAAQPDRVEPLDLLGAFWAELQGGPLPEPARAVARDAVGRALAAQA
ncbi:MAG TPA: exonuclease SbcCD subunit D [Crenalkalicoccus sp.]|nr:exonuclease SbcCD subunit D [Crenalkalicoccus sp.]